MTGVGWLRSAALTLVATLCVSLVSVAPAHAARSADDFDKEVVRLVNVERAKRDLPALKVVPTLQTKARNWSKTMSSSGSFEHAPPKRISADNTASGCSVGWAENIFWSTGSKPSAKQTVKAYMNSPGHRAAILSRSYGFMASGTVIRGTQVHNTQRFAVKCTTTKVSGWQTKQTAKLNKAVSDTVKVNGGQRHVTLQQHNGQKWVTVKKLTTAADGRVTVPFPKSTKAKSVKFRLVVSAKGKFVQGTSKTKVLRFAK